MSTKIIDSYLDFVQKEQDELTLQKNYLSEATKILNSNQLMDSYNSFMKCLNDYPSYLFKKEKEFMFFMAKVNEFLKIDASDSLNFHDPNIQLVIDDLHYKVDIYHTVQGIYEMNFSYENIDMALRVEVDMPNKVMTVLTQDLLHLNVSGNVKSKMVHYLTDLMDLMKTIEFTIKRETTTNIDPFLMFSELSFQRSPYFTDSAYDKLFIAMDGSGEMQYANSSNNVHLILDEENEVFIESSPVENVADIKISHKQGQIYLFDLLALHPYVEQLFIGEVIFSED